MKRDLRNETRILQNYVKSAVLGSLETFKIFANVLSNFDELPRYSKKLLLTRWQVLKHVGKFELVSKFFLKYLGNLSKFDKTLAKILEGL